MTKRTYTHWTAENLAEVAKQYKTRGEFNAGNPTAYMAAKRRNLLKLICAHMSKGRFFWTRNLIEVEAKRFTTRSDFAREAKAAYSAAARLGILDEVCEHMPKYAGKGKKRGPNKRGKAKAEKTVTDLNAMMGLNG